MYRKIGRFETNYQIDLFCAVCVFILLHFVLLEKITFRFIGPPHFVLPDLGEKCATTYREFFKQNNRPGAVTLFPGVADTLQRLHNRHIHLSFASSRSHASLAAYVNDLGLSPFISYLIGADDVHRPKPKAEPVEVTLRHFGIAPKDALVVGDTKFDILMGHNAGTHTCGVSYGNGSREELEKAGAEHIIDTFTALSDL